MHLTSSPIDWYAARAGGIVAYVLLSANVAIGLSMTGKKSMKHWPRFALEDVHRFGGILVGTFLVVHITAVAIDAYLPFSLTSLVVPLVASYRPIWTALGIVAAELLLALAFTNHYRNVEISYRFWRRAHFVNFVVWGSATLHGLGSGTDRSAAWFVSIYAVAVGTVCALTVWRVLRRWHPSPEWVLRLAPVTVAADRRRVDRRARAWAAPLPAEGVERGELQRHVGREDPRQQRRHPRDGLDGGQRVGVAARARASRSAGLTAASRLHGVPDGIPPERSAL